MSAYRRRVHVLAGLYVAMFALCLAGEALLFRQGRLFVTLAQRSNVETLTLAFFALFYGYLALVSAPGAWGAAKLGLAAAAPRARRELRKTRWLPKKEKRRTAVLNRIVELEDAAPPALPLADGHGEIGRLELHGVRLVQRSFVGDGSNNLFAFVVERIKRGGGREAARLDIVEWQTIDDEEAEKFGCLVEFAQNLERLHQGAKLWPRVVLPRSAWEELRASLAELCPALRAEAFLPDWEFSGEHKIPIIPEPLGIVSIGRREKRVDPLASMFSAFTVVLASFLLLVWITWRPPWVPG